MAGVNKVILIGNLGSDPEVRHLEGGSTVANFNIATSESYTNKSGERITQTEWHRIELWDGLARLAEQYLKKGNSVYIEGKLRTDSWQDKEGNNRYTTKIRGLSMNFLGSPNSDSGDQGGQHSQSNQPSAQANQPTSQSAQSTPAQKPEDETDDLPF